MTPTRNPAGANGRARNVDHLGGLIGAEIKRQPIPVQGVLRWRQGAHANGFRIVPVVTDGKRPIGLAWPEEARLAARPVSVDPHAANSGVLCDGLRAVDIDCDQLTVALAVKQLARELLGYAPVRIRGNSPRSLLLYLAADGEPRKISLSGTRGGVEILGHGQQFVGHGRHPTGVSYRWPNGSPADFPRTSLLAVTEDQLAKFLQRVRPIIGAAPPPHPAPRMPSPVVVSAPAYAAAVLRREAAAITTAPDGAQEDTLNDAAFKVGRRVAQGRVDRDVAERVLIDAGLRMINHDPHRPWTAGEINKKVRRALDAGARGGRP